MDSRFSFDPEHHAALDRGPGGVAGCRWRVREGAAHAVLRHHPIANSPTRLVPPRRSYDATAQLSDIPSRPWSVEGGKDSRSLGIVRIPFHVRHRPGRTLPMTGARNSPLVRLTT